MSEEYNKDNGFEISLKGEQVWPPEVVMFAKVEGSDEVKGVLDECN